MAVIRAGTLAVPDILWATANEPSGTDITSGVGVSLTTNGTRVSGPKTNTNGVNFNGSSQYASSDLSLDFKSQSRITVAFWVKATTWPADGTNQVLIGSTATGAAHSFLVHNNWGEMQINLYQSYISNISAQFNFAGPTTGVWTHYSVLLDTGIATGYIRLWKNGIEQTPISIYSDRTIASTFQNNQITLGSMFGVNRWFNGAMSDIRIYSGDRINDIVRYVI